mgnify:FL=1
MEIGGGGNLYTIAPGTPTSPIKPELELTPEESNELVDRTLDKVEEVQDAEQASQDLTRQTFVGLVEAQLQQNNIERFIEASTDQDIDNDSVDAADLIDAKQLNETAANIQNPPSRPDQGSSLNGNQNILDEGAAETNITPEQTNNAIDQALDTVNDFQNAQQATQDLTRQTVVGLVENEFEQDNVERFIEASTDQEIDNNSPSINDLIEVQQLNQLANNADSVAVRRDQESPQDQLQERIENIVDGGIKIQPVVDLLV